MNKQIEEMASIIFSKINGANFDDVNDAVIALYNAGYRKHSEGEWISVDERLPDREGKYLAHTSHGCTMICFYVDYHCNGKPDWERHDVTHWMPLPNPPKMKKTQN